MLGCTGPARLMGPHDGEVSDRVFSRISNMGCEPTLGGPLPFPPVVHEISLLKNLF